MGHPELWLREDLVEKQVLRDAQNDKSFLWL
jgi:hypothetical protein